MSRNALILSKLLSKGIRPVGSVIENPEVENSFMVFLEKTYDDDGHERPSKRSISIVKKELEEQNISISIAFLDEKAIRLEKAVSTMLNSKLQNVVRRSTVALEGGEALISIELSDQASDADRKTIESETVELLGFLGTTATRFLFSNSLEPPTMTAILGTVRKHAPVSIEVLVQKLVRAGFAEPAEAWLNGILDRWRRKGLVSRRPDKRYVLTLAGLNFAGTRRKRNSPDVSRALAMNRLD